MAQSWYGSTIWGLPSFAPDVWASPKDSNKVVQPDSFWKSESASWSPLLGLSSPPLSPLPAAEPLLESPVPAKLEPSGVLLREPQVPLFVPVTGLAGWNSASQQQQQQQADDIEQQLNKQCLYKTELCRSFEETGKCRYATKCQFAHGRAELRPVLRHPKYKTEICKTYQSNGTCPYGSRCRFIHVPEEAAAKTEQAVAPVAAAPADAAAADSPRQKRTKRRTRRASPATPPQVADAPAANTPEPETKSRLSIFKQLVPLD